MKKRILELIEGEDKKNPLTDDEIAIRLGINRKTVTLNRQEAGIADSRERKRPVLKARLRELIKEDSAMSERELTRRLEAEGFVVGKYVVGRLAEEIREEYRSATGNCWKNRKESFFADILGKAGHQRVSEFYRL